MGNGSKTDNSFTLTSASHFCCRVARVVSEHDIEENAYKCPYCGWTIAISDNDDSNSRP